MGTLVQTPSISMVTRRMFLASGLAASTANGNSSTKVRIATSGFMWQKEIEEGIRTTARMGFHGIEPFRSHILRCLDDPLALKARLDEAGISLVTCSNGGPMSVNFIDPAKVNQTIENHFVFARDFIAKFGCKHFKINLGGRPEGGPSRRHLKTMANALTELGKRTADVGLRPRPASAHLVAA